MKRNLLRFAATFVVAVAAVFGLQAQTDVTSQYLANAGFDQDVMYGIDADITTELSLGSANGGANVKAVTSWEKGTIGDNSAAATFAYGSPKQLNGNLAPATDQAGLTDGGVLGISTAWTGTITYTQATALPAGVYKLAYAAYNNGPAAANTSRVGVTYGGSSVLSTVVSFPMTQWTLDTITFTVPYSFAAPITPVTVQVGISSGNVGSGGVGRIFFDYVKLIQVESLAPAVSYDEPEELVGKIVNGDFAVAPANGWTTPVAGYNSQVAEAFQAAYNMSQTITGLTPGYYTVQYQAFQREKGNDSGAAYAAGTEVIESETYVTSGGNEWTAPFPSLYSEAGLQAILGGGGWLNGYLNNLAITKTAFDAGYYVTKIRNIEVGEDGTLTVGARAAYPNGIPTGAWAAMDNFKLYAQKQFLGAPQDALAAVKAATAYLEGTPYANAAAIAAVDAAISTIGGYVLDPETTDSAYTAATVVLEAAFNALKANEKGLADLQAAITAANAGKTAYETYSGYAAYEAAIATAETAYTAATATPDAALAALQQAERNCRFTDPSGDFTFVVVNPNADLGGSTGWSTDFTGNNFGTATNQQGDFTGDFLERWVATPQVGRPIYQTITGLPVGRYELTMAAFQDSGTDGATSIFINDSKTPIPTGGGGKTLTAEAFITDGVATIGLVATIATGWSGLDNVKLKYLGDPNAEPTAPVQVKPVVDGEYVIYYPGTNQYLTSRETGFVVNSHNNVVVAPLTVEGGDAFVWQVTAKAYIAGATTPRDTVALVQKSSGYTFSSGTDNWSTALYETGNANIRNWLLTDVATGYNLTSLKNTGAYIDVDNGTGPLYFDKAASRAAIFQFYEPTSYFAYFPVKQLYDTKVSLLAAINEAKEYQKGILGGIHTEEDDIALAAGIEAALAAYSDETIDQTAAEEALAAIKEAISTYQWATNATPENPADYTFAVVNPNADQGRTGWVTEFLGNPNNFGAASNQAGDFTVPFLERWVGTGETGRSIYQTVAGLPNGRYELTAAAFNNNATEGAASLFINDGKTVIPTGDGGKTLTVEGIVSDGTATFGIVVDIATQWTGIDNVKLTYYGNSTDIKKEILQGRVDEALAVTADTIVLQASVKATLSSTATAAAEAIADEAVTVEVLDSLTAKIEIDLAQANASVAAYGSLLTWNSTIADKLVQFGITEPSEELATSMTQGATLYEEATDTASVINAFVAAATLAFNTDAVAANNHEATFLLVNPRFDDGLAGWTAATWGTFNGANTQWTGWNADYATAPANNIVLDAGADNSIAYQTINAPAGYYVVSAVGRGSSVDVVDPTDFKLFINNGTDSTEVVIPRMGDTGQKYNHGWNRVKTGIELAAAGNLTVGVRQGVNNQWESADDFKLSWYKDYAEYEEVVLNAYQDALAAIDAKIAIADSIINVDTLMRPRFILVGAVQVALVAANDAAKAMRATADDAEYTADLVAAADALTTPIANAGVSSERATAVYNIYDTAVDTVAYVTTVMGWDATKGQKLIEDIETEIALYTADLATETPRRTNPQILLSRNKVQGYLDAYFAWLTSVPEIGAEGVKAYFDGTTIVVEGADNYTIYSITGAQVPAGKALAAGAYIVKVAGKAIKVVIP